MKNVLKISLILVLALSFTTSTFAQNDDYKSNIYVGAGFSAISTVVEAFTSNVIAKGGGITSSKSAPAFQITYDYGIEKWISVGAGLSYQQFSVDVEDYTFSIGSDSITESFGVNANRFVAGARIMFHYANNDNIDLYSGVRLNYKTMNVSTTSTNRNLNLDAFNIAVPFAAQLVILGARLYVTDNIGLSAEVAFGAPHFLSIGANYRM